MTQLLERLSAQSFPGEGGIALAIQPNPRGTLNENLRPSIGFDRRPISADEKLDCQTVNVEDGRLTAADLSHAYTRAVSAYWRGESIALLKFETWLAQFWAAGPPEPVTAPAARCPHAAGGRGIRWHECDQELLGYVSGRSGCLRVPRMISLPGTPGSDAPKRSFAVEGRDSANEGVRHAT